MKITEKEGQLTEDVCQLVPVGGGGQLVSGGWEGLVRDGQELHGPSQVFQGDLQGGIQEDASTLLGLTLHPQAQTRGQQVQVKLLAEQRSKAHVHFKSPFCYETKKSL